MIEPEDEASGTAEVFVQVIDEVGNVWTDSFLVEVEPVMDSKHQLRGPRSILYEEKSSLRRVETKTSLEVGARRHI